jgi:hypothetical protein
LARFGPGQYAGSKVCVTCHNQQSSQHVKSGHARSLSRASEHPLKSEWRANPGEWAFGAGDQAVTFVSPADEDHYIEHGLTYYAASRSLKITPGHKNDAGERYRTFDPDASILRCFQCHSTGPLKLSAGFRIEPSEMGVQCESCHGPAAAHAASQKPIINPGKLTAGQINELCGACHRKPAASGDDTDWSNPWNARHQPLYLDKSACFVKSKGALSCVTCHAAHQPVSRNSTDYDRRCEGCHSARHKASVTRRSCVSCHMPEVKPSPDLRFANHWIGVYATGAPLRPIAR